MNKDQSISTAANDIACVNLQMLRASHYIMKAYDEAYRPLGIRATQMPVLGVVARSGPVSIKAIADEMESERSVISRKLQVMEKNGWIAEDGSGAKEKNFVLTNEGRALINHVLPVRMKVQNRLLSILSDEEQQLLFSLCNKLKSASTE